MINACIPPILPKTEPQTFLTTKLSTIILVSICRSLNNAPLGIHLEYSSLFYKLSFTWND